MMGRSKKILKMTKRKISLRTQNQKGNSGEIPEPVKSELGKDTKGDSYPAKRTQSSGPVTWDCPFCEDKKYADNLEYLVHLQKAHKCNLQGHAVKKEMKKGKPGKSSKGQGKR